MDDIRKTYEHLEDTYLDISKRYLKVDEITVDKRLVQHTGVFAFFGAVLAYAKRELDKAVNNGEYEEATCREARRAELLEEGKKATDRALDAYVKTVSSIMVLTQLKEEASYKYNLAKNIVNSLDHQKDILIQISANKRAESKLIGDL